MLSVSDGKTQWNLETAPPFKILSVQHLFQDAYEGETLVHEENVEVVTNAFEDIKIANENSTASSEKLTLGGDIRQDWGYELYCTITVCIRSLDQFYINLARRVKLATKKYPVGQNFN